MPELPEVETIRRGLAPFVEGARIGKVVLNRPDLRFAFPADFAERLQGQTIVRTSRRAKYLLFALSGGETLLCHLGMTGNFRFEDGAPGENGRHDHVVFFLDHPERGETRLIYMDPRRFGFMDIFSDPASCSFLGGLGPEPLGNQMNAKELARRLWRRKAPIKAALLDQRVVAGLGNIYVCEALWRARISPLAAAGTLVAEGGAPTARLEALTSAIRAVLDEAIIAGGSTLKDFRQANGESGYFQHSFNVYDREGEPCRAPGCTGSVARLVQSGRSSFFCPVCQGESTRKSVDIAPEASL